MNKYLSRCLVSAGVALLVMTASAAPSPTGIVKGSVSGADGSVAGARVVIASGSDSSYTASATTDKEGTFTFSNAPLGEVEVKVYNSQDNLIATGKGVLKAAGETITLILRAP
jgi:hypothetical protein